VFSETRNYTEGADRSPELFVLGGVGLKFRTVAWALQIGAQFKTASVSWFVASLTNVMGEKPADYGQRRRPTPWGGKDGAEVEK